MRPAVSVLIPVYNGAAYIGEAIESVLKQTFAPLEILVADDGSTDQSAAIACSYPGVRCFSLPHGGVAAARNRLVGEARGEWVAFLDADDRWLPDKLEIQTAYLRDHPCCEIVFCRYRNFTDLPPDTLTERQKRVLSVEIDRNPVGACIKKTVFERCGLFETGRSYGEDTEWIARLNMRGEDLSHLVEQPLFERRIHDSNTTLSHEAPGREEYLALMADAVRNAIKRGK